MEGVTAIDVAFAKVMRARHKKKGRRLDAIHRGFTRVFSKYRQDRLKENYLGICKVLARTGNDVLARVGKQWWNQYAVCVLADPSTFDHEEEQLEALSGALDAELLEPNAWLELYRTCLISGLYNVGLVIRSKAEARICSRECGDLSDVRYQFALAVEQGDWDHAGRLCSSLSHFGESEEHLAYATWIASLGSRDSKQPYLPEGEFAPQNQAMYERVRDHSVALVGPVPVEEQNGCEIDQFDLVAKFNFKGGWSGCDSDTQGSRVDIAYYNIQQSKHIARKMPPDFLSTLDFAVFMKQKGLRVLKNWVNNGRTVVNLQWMLLDSELNAGPNAIYDLLRFCPSRLKVFNTDLMLTAGRFEGYAQPGGEEINYSFSFAKTHDPVLQFNFFKRAWEANLIEGDTRLQRVMALSLKEYIAKLQSGHGSIAREALSGRIGQSI